jgi:hypothetical protein
MKFKAEVISQHQAHFRDLASAQSPKVMVIACCDSRVDPALLMGAGPGDIFIVRCVAHARSARAHARGPPRSGCAHGRTHMPRSFPALQQHRQPGAAV